MAQITLTQNPQIYSFEARIDETSETYPYVLDVVYRAWVNNVPVYQRVSFQLPNATLPPTFWEATAAPAALGAYTAAGYDYAIP